MTCPGIRNVSELDVSQLYDPKLVDEILEIDFELAYRNRRRARPPRGPARRPQLRA